MGSTLACIMHDSHDVPTTVMANGDSLAGPDAEKKVIENDLIVQLPSSLDDMIGTSAGNGDWLAVAAEPT